MKEGIFIYLYIYIRYVSLVIVKDQVLNHFKKRLLALIVFFFINENCLSSKPLPYQFNEIVALSPKLLNSSSAQLRAQVHNCGLEPSIGRSQANFLNLATVVKTMDWRLKSWIGGSSHLSEDQAVDRELKDSICRLEPAVTSSSTQLGDQRLNLGDQTADQRLRPKTFCSKISGSGSEG